MTETTMATTMATTLARTMATRMTTTKRAASLVAVFLGLILMAGSAGAEGRSGCLSKTCRTGSGGTTGT